MSVNLFDEMGGYVTDCWIDEMVVSRAGLKASEMDVNTVVWTTD